MTKEQLTKMREYGFTLYEAGTYREIKSIESVQIEDVVFAANGFTVVLKQPSMIGCLTVTVHRAEFRSKDGFRETIHVWATNIVEQDNSEIDSHEGLLVFTKTMNGLLQSVGVLMIDFNRENPQYNTAYGPLRLVFAYGGIAELLRREESVIWRRLPLEGERMKILPLEEANRLAEEIATTGKTPA
jgi:hypothetical protein